MADTAARFRRNVVALADVRATVADCYRKPDCNATFQPSNRHSNDSRECEMGVAERAMAIR